jgi:hypothetical protein
LPTAGNPTASFAALLPAPVGVPDFFIEKFRIPPFLLSIYQAAGVEYSVPWQVLAAINEIETDYGRNLSVSSAGAVGWMQFLPATWKTYGVDANGDGVRDPYNPVDAIFAAARYLRAAGGARDLRGAVFAYNHAGWYVDSVMLRAKLIGGLPADLVSSITGLTEGHFPVHAAARYADDTLEAKQHARVARSANRKLVLSDPARSAISIFARAGAPAVAVQDGVIVGLGVSRRIGSYVKLRDAYGNTYTYAGLKRIAPVYPVAKPKAQSAQSVSQELALPAARDPKPRAPASAGHQPASLKAAGAALLGGARTATDTLSSDVGALAQQRLFAHPKRPAAFVAGGRDQLANRRSLRLSNYFTQVFGLQRDEITLKPLRKGARVIAGTILGRLGRTTAHQAAHLSFMIRPAGKTSPLIDPKPILDGWKLLESTAIYRAQDKNPFFGPDSRNPTIGQILLESKEALARQVLLDPSIEIYTCGRRDIQAGQIDRRILAALKFLSASGLKPSVSALKCGHGLFTNTGNISEHATGNGVDIAKINGIPIIGHQGPGTITDITIRRLLTLQGDYQPHQIISLMQYPASTNTFAQPDHADHIHIGYQPHYDPNTKLGQTINAILKPNQWIKLITRLGQITNPTIPHKPSKDAIPNSTPPNSD